MKVEIEKVDNGYILKSIYYCPADEESETEISVYEEGEERKEQCEKFITLLHKLIEVIGPSYEKYGMHNISLSIEPGHKVDIDTSNDLDN